MGSYVMTRTLIRNATLIDAAQTLEETDLLIAGEKIHQVGQNLNVPYDEEVDASNSWLIPGGIDVHTHLEMPLRDEIWSSDDFLSGTLAAAFGGTTSLIDFPTQPRGGNLKKAVDQWMERASEKAVIDYGFHGIVTDFTPRTQRDMASLSKNGITSFKFFMAYPDSLMMEDTTLFKAFRHCRHIQALPMIHAESGRLIDLFVDEAIRNKKKKPIYHARTRPTLTESEAIYRAGHIAKLAGSPLYIVHLSSKQGLEAIINLRLQGMRILTETCPQYLFLNETAYLEKNNGGVKYIMSPPLRPQDSPPFLKIGLAAGDIPIIATDHCPFPLKLKLKHIEEGFHKVPNGGPGIETRLLLTYHNLVKKGSLTPNQWVEANSTNPAKTFGMYPRKGCFLPGSDADLCIFNPFGETTLSHETLHMDVDYNPFEGQTLSGSVETVFSRGEKIIEHGEFLGRKGRGSFIKRLPFNDRETT
jgi:dihydropyrimidinase